MAAPNGEPTMPDEPYSDRVDKVRRKLLTSAATATALLTAGHLAYTRPAVRSFFGVRSAWAQPTGLSVRFCGEQPDLGGGLGTGQDAWEYDVIQPNTTLTIDARIPVGIPQREVGLFAPGVPTTGINLLTGAALTGYLGPFPVTHTVADAGTYTIAIEDHKSDALETPFSYCLEITADRPLMPGAQVIDDGPESLGPASPP